MAVQEGSLKVINVDKHGRRKTLRRLDLIDKWFDDGIITSDQFSSAQRFSLDFHASGYTGLPSAVNTQTVFVSSFNNKANALDTACDARQRIKLAMLALGKPGDSAVWFIVGAGWSITDWARGAAWGHRPMDFNTARGVLLSALGALSEAYRKRL